MKYSSPCIAPEFESGEYLLYYVVILKIIVYVLP